MSATRECSRCIQDLPAEMLLEIFKYLSVHERKAVRRACKRWFKICDHPSLSKDEVINCPGCYQLEDTYALLNKSKRKLLHLMFDHVEFSDDSLFWKMNGSRIRSITLKNCRFDEQLLERIVNLCEKCFNLNIEYNTSYEEILSFSNLTRIVENGIVRENSPLDHQDYINSILAQKRALQTKLSIHEEPITSVITKYLRAAKGRRASLYFSFNYWKLLYKDYDHISRILPDLKKSIQEVPLIATEAEEQKLENRLTSTKYISVFYYKTSNYSSVESFLVKLFQSKSISKDFKLITFLDLVVTKCLFETLMSSNLKSCQLDIGGNISIQDLEFFRVYSSAEPKPAALPGLSVSLFNCTPKENDTLSFLQYFPSIRSLYISYMSPRILQTLLKYQTKLKGLMGRCSRRGQTKEYIRIFQDAFHQMTDLQRLELDDLLTYAFQKSLSPDQVFANLRYLKINLSAHICGSGLEATSATDVLKLADSTPHLEALYITECRHRNLCFANLCSELCTKLTQLRYLRWEECKKGLFCSDECYRNLFSICSSLRVLRHQSKRINKYFFDMLSKKVTRVEDDCDFYTFASPTIGGLTINWLSF